MIAKRFIRIFFPAAQIKTTIVTTTIENCDFISNTSKIIENGWFEVDAFPNEKKCSLKDIKKGDYVNNKRILVTENETKPPKRYTDNTLIEAMENCGKKLEDKELAKLINKSGIGTSATRADIIENLVTHKYIERKGKTIYPTDLGMLLIDNLPIEDIKSAEMTAKWEKNLEEIRQGNKTLNEYMDEIICFTTKICEEINQITDSKIQSKNEVGKCPKCGQAVCKGKYGFYCTGKCGMNVAKVYGKELTEKQLEKLLAGKEISYTVKGKKTIVIPQIASNEYNGKTYYQWKTKRG